MKLSNRDKIMILFIMLVFGVSKAMGDIIPAWVGNVVLFLAPIYLIWLILRYKQPTKIRQKISLAGFICFGVTFYVTFIASVCEEYNIYAFYKYKVIFLIGIIIPAVAGIIIAFVGRIFFYDDSNSWRR